MDLSTYAEQRLAGVPPKERTPYTKAVKAVYRGYESGISPSSIAPDVEAVRAASDRELLALPSFGRGALTALRELLWQESLPS